MPCQKSHDFCYARIFHPFVVVSPMSERVFNFSAGPAALPLPVLQQAQAEMLSLHDAAGESIGMSVMEISHRSQTFIDIANSAKARLTVAAEDAGATTTCSSCKAGRGCNSRWCRSILLRGLRQDCPVHPHRIVGQEGLQPRRGAKAKYTSLGTEPRRITTGSPALPRPISDDAAYVHITSNETIEGVQFAAEPDVGAAPLVADCSSDFLHRPTCWSTSTV